MAGFEGELFQDDADFRRGDQPPETHIDGFAVYGGTPADREALSGSDPALADELERELRDILDGYGDAVHGDRAGDQSIRGNEGGRD